MHFISVEQTATGYVASIDGRASAPYDQIDRPTLSRDGRRFAFWARRGDRWRVVADGKEGAAYDHRPFPVDASFDTGDGRLVFSPDGRRLAYAAQQGAQYRMVVDGVAGPLYGNAGPPTFSPDGRHVAYVAWAGPAGPSGRRVVGTGNRIVLDGREGPAYDAVWPPRFSADSEHTVYVARKGTQFVVVLDGKEGPSFERLDDQQPFFARSGHRIAYVGSVGGRDYVVVDGERRGPFESVGNLDNPPTFSPDGRRLAYIVREGGRAFVMLDGKPQPPADEVEAFVFSPDSRRYAYWSKNGSEWRVVVDGRNGPPYSGNLSLVIDGTHPVFSPDSKRIAYTAWKGGTGKRADITLCAKDTHRASDAGIEGARAVAVVDGVEGPEFERVRDLRFSADSRRVAYTGFTAGLFGIQMVDGRALSSAPALYRGVEFSRDGRHVAFVAGLRRDESPPALANGTECDGNVPVAIVIDGQPGPLYDSILLSGESFQPDGTVEYLATMNAIVYRVRQLPPSASSPVATGNRPR